MPGPFASQPLLNVGGSVHRRKPAPKAIRDTISSTPSKSDVAMTSVLILLVVVAEDEEGCTNCQQLSRRRLNSLQKKTIYREHSKRY